MGLNMWKKPIWITELDYLDGTGHKIITIDADTIISCEYYGDFTHPSYPMSFEYHTEDKELFLFFRNPIKDKVLVEVSYYSKRKDRQFKLDKLL